jgi:hypothetical protein
MLRDLQSMEQVCGAGFPGKGAYPGASARGCYAARHKRSIPMLKKKVSIVLVPIIVIPLLGLLIFWLTEFPRYLTLETSPPNEYLKDVYWSNTQRSVLTWDTSYTKYFLWRREGSVHSDPDATWIDVISDFDRWITSNGWIRFSSSGRFPTCEQWLPEAKFVDPGEDGYYVYHLDDYDINSRHPLLCLAIWPYSYGGQVRGYDVVLVIGKPSPLTRFMGEMD